MRFFTALRAVALFEAAKGLLILAAGLGLPRFIDSNAIEYVARVLEHFHFNPAHRSPTVFLDALASMSDTRLHWLAAGAAAYAAVRLIEAYGLWHERSWAEWFAAISGGLYLPFELVALVRRMDALAFTALVVNLAIVLFMLDALRRKRRRLAVTPADGSFFQRK